MADNLYLNSLSLLGDKLREPDLGNSAYTLRKPVLDIRGVMNSRPHSQNRSVETETRTPESVNQMLFAQIPRPTYEPRMNIAGLRAGEPKKRIYDYAWDIARKGIEDPLNDGSKSVRERTVLSKNMQDTKKRIFKGTEGNTLALSIAMQESSSLSSNYPLGDVYPSLNQSYFSRLKLPTLDARSIAQPGVLQGQNLRLNITDYSIFNYQYQKTGDAANYGLFKMNWYMIKQTETGSGLISRAGADLKVRDFNDSRIQDQVGDLINKDDNLAIRILNDAMKKWSMDPPDPTKPEPDNFWAGHRWGSSGLNNEGNANWYDIQNYYRGVQDIHQRVKKDSKIWENSQRPWVDIPNI